MSHTTITAVWQGATGLPGYTKLRFDGELDALAAAACAARMRAMFDALKFWIPTSVSISWDGLAQVYGSNGQLTGEVPYSPPANVTGVGMGGFSAASGACVNWLTGLFVNGKRIRAHVPRAPRRVLRGQRDAELRGRVRDLAGRGRPRGWDARPRRGLAVGRRVHHRPRRRGVRP